MAKDDVVTVLTTALGGFERVVEHVSPADLFHVDGH